MTVHEQFAEDLSLYALGTLRGEERAALERHLNTCPACRAELERLRGDAALLAFSVSGPKPPARSRERLFAAIGKEPRRTLVRVQERAETRPAKTNPWWSAFQWAAAAAAVVVVLLLVRQNSELQRRAADLQVSSARDQQQLQQAKELAATLTAPDAARYVLVAAKTPPQPQGRAIYAASSGTLVFLASNMPALPPQKVYELWLIPENGAPVPAGIFRPNAEGSGAVVKPALPAGLEAKTFAITVEPETGSAAPTSAILMLGTKG